MRRLNSRLRSALAIAAISTLAAPASSHDFWLEPDDYWIDPGKPETWLRFRIGHSDVNEPWRLVWDRLASLRTLANGTIIDHQADVVVRSGDNSGGARLRLPNVPGGTVIVSMESHHSLSDLPADRFNDYARKEGLKAILAHREAIGQQAASGRELYSRRAKALLQLGPEPKGDVTRPVGHTLEIVPEQNPYALKPGELLTVRVLYRGLPLSGALIDMRVLSPFSAEVAVRETDPEGRARFTLPAAGKVKINTVWGMPISGHAQADYETVFASLTFGYPGAPRSLERIELR